jgi:hypothetical protein
MHRFDIKGKHDQREELKATPADHKGVIPKGRGLISGPRDLPNTADSREIPRST